MDVSTGLIDYPALERNAELCKPKMNLAAIGCYSRKLNYARYCDVVHFTTNCSAPDCTGLHWTGRHCTALPCTALHTVYQVPGDLVAAGEAHPCRTRFSFMETLYS